MEEKFQPDPASPEEPSKPGNLHYAIAAYIPFLCFLALFSKEADDFSRHHGKQGLLLLIAEILAIFMLLPIGAFFWKVVLIACLIASFAGIVYAYTGRKFTLPLIGKWGDKL